MAAQYVSLYTGAILKRLGDYCKEMLLQQTPDCYTLNSQLENYKDKNYWFKDAVFELFPG